MLLAGKEKIAILPSQKKIIKRREDKMKQSKEIIAQLSEFVKEMVKDALQSLMKEERLIYLEEHPTKANGFYRRSLATRFGTIEDLSVPRVREGNFRPSCLPPYRRRSLDLEEVIIAMYRGGLSTRDISKFLENLYGTRYSPAGISRLTDVLEKEIEAWRKRPLKEYYPVLYIDATFLPVRRERVEKEPCYIALGIDEDGKKEIFTLWMSSSNGESSLLWQEVLETLRERGLRQVLLILGDGLTGLREVAEKVYPKADFQSCVLHKVRASLNKVRRRDREKTSRDLKRIYQVNSKKEALLGLENLKRNWRRIYPELARSY